MGMMTGIDGEWRGEGEWEEGIGEQGQEKD